MHPNTALCLALLGQQSCHYVTRAEYFVSRASASIALLMALPLVAMFIVDLTIFSLQSLYLYIGRRWPLAKAPPLADTGFKFKSPNLVRKIIHDWNITKARCRLIGYAWLARTRRKH